MGISELHKHLEACKVPVNVAIYKGESVGVDISLWIYKGLYGCCNQLLHDKHTDRYIHYCAKRVDLLLSKGVTPVIVFDGRPLPAKSRVHEERRKRRLESKAKAQEMMDNGDIHGALETFKKSLTVSNDMARAVHKMCREKGVQCIIAPYEADAQLAYLYKRKYITTVITEDSDLIPFGVNRILTKMADNGDGYEFCGSRLVGNRDLKIELRGWTSGRLLELCVMSGCDYLQSIPQVGFLTAHKYLHKYKSAENALVHMRTDGMRVPDDYEQRFREAVAIFRHQLIYDPVSQRAKPLNAFTKTDTFTHNDVAHLIGPHFGDQNAHGVATGVLHPITLERYTKEACSIAIDDEEDVPDREKVPKSVDMAAKKLHNPLASTVENVLDRENVPDSVNVPSAENQKRFIDCDLLPSRKRPASAFTTTKRLSLDLT